MDFFLVQHGPEHVELRKYPFTNGRCFNHSNLEMRILKRKRGNGCFILKIKMQCIVFLASYLYLVHIIFHFVSPMDLCTGNI